MCTLWQVVQVRFRAACAPASQPACAAAVVAGETRRARLGRLHARELEDVALRIVVHVRLAWTVTTLAPAIGRRRAWIPLLAVPRAVKAGLLLLVAEDARIRARITGGRLSGGSRLRGGRLRGGRLSGGGFGRETRLHATASGCRRDDHHTPDDDDGPESA